MYLVRRLYLRSVSYEMSKFLPLNSKWGLVGPLFLLDIKKKKSRRLGIGSTLVLTNKKNKKAQGTVHGLYIDHKLRKKVI